MNLKKNKTIYFLVLLFLNTFGFAIGNYLGYSSEQNTILSIIIKPIFPTIVSIIFLSFIVKLFNKLFIKDKKIDSILIAIQIAGFFSIFGILFSLQKALF